MGRGSEAHGIYHSFIQIALEQHKLRLRLGVEVLPSSGCAPGSLNFELSGLRVIMPSFMQGTLVLDPTELLVVYLYAIYAPNTDCAAIDGERRQCRLSAARPCALPAHFVTNLRSGLQASGAEGFVFLSPVSSDAVTCQYASRTTSRE